MFEIRLLFSVIFMIMIWSDFMIMYVYGVWIFYYVLILTD